MNKIYQDRNWLYQKYWIEKLKVINIANKCNVNEKTIRRWLRKLNIPIRYRPEFTHLCRVNHCQLIPKAIQWLNGEMLGDGNIQSNSKYSARFQYTSKYWNYINYISQTLNSFGIKQGGKINKTYHKDFDCYTYHYCSLSYEKLLELKEKWYSNGHKIIPKDIKLISVTLRQHYLGDGSLVHQRKGNGNPYIVLAMYGFSINNINFYINQLNDLGFKATKRKTKNTVAISAYSTKKFLNYIGECPCEVYNYKWKK